MSSDTRPSEAQALAAARVHFLEQQGCAVSDAGAEDFMAAVTWGWHAAQGYTPASSPARG